MTDTPDPAAAALPLPAEVADPAVPPVLDAHGFDPAAFEWRPVPRRPRADGWSPDVQRRFVEALADTGLVSAAAERVDMSVQSAYRLRRAPGGEPFARAWDEALAAAADHLAATAFSRALEGVDIPVFDRDGVRIGSKRQYNDRLLMFLLRAYRPERFGSLERAAGPAPVQLPAPEARAIQPARSATPAGALGAALERLGPVTPDEPHRLMPPDRLADALDGAAAMANLFELYPDIERERYTRPRLEDPAPAALDRQRRRAARERSHWERDRERDGEW